MGIALILSASLIYAKNSPWEDIKSPIPGKMESVGSYTNGCMIGAKSLPLEGKGYQVMRAYKNRFYGHEYLVQFIQKLAKKSSQLGLPTLLIGDMGMAAGGRFASGHASHQTGLDSDIWLRFGPLSKKDLKAPEPLYVVDYKAKEVNQNWTSDQATLIRLAAEDQRVARIFVNPAIKVKLCESTRGDRTWLRKIRPWYGHRAHMHVRLKCPKGSMNCKDQFPVAKGDGCDSTLYAWFKPKKTSQKTKRPHSKPALPKQCQKILLNQGILELIKD